MVGKFIVIEGLEGAGKSSAIAHVKQLVEARGKQVTSNREPGGTPMAEAIRSLVKEPRDNEQVASMTELLLMYAARVQLVEHVIKPALQSGDWVIGDRHDLSSQAYQGGGRQLGEQTLQHLKTLALGDFQPDLTIYMDVEPAVGLARARGRGQLDRIEQEDIAFFERTRARYLAIAADDPRIVTIDSQQPLTKVHADISVALDRYLDSLQ